MTYIKKGTAPDNTARDLEIYNKRLSGKKFSEIAEEYKLTHSRCREIFEKQERIKAFLLHKETERAKVNGGIILDDVAVSVRIANCLKNANINTIEDVLEITAGNTAPTCNDYFFKGELIPNIGQVSIAQIDEVLARAGLFRKQPKVVEEKNQTIEALKEIRREIRRVNQAAGQTIFNPAATDALEQLLKDNGVLTSVLKDEVMFMTVGK